MGPYRTPPTEEPIVFPTNEELIETTKKARGIIDNNYFQLVKDCLTPTELKALIAKIKLAASQGKDIATHAFRLNTFLATREEAELVSKLLIKELVKDIHLTMVSSYGRDGYKGYYPEVIFTWSVR